MRPNKMIPPKPSNLRGLYFIVINVFPISTLVNYRRASGKQLITTREFLLYSIKGQILFAAGYSSCKAFLCCELILAGCVWENDEVPTLACVCLGPAWK